MRSRRLSPGNAMLPPVEHLIKYIYVVDQRTLCEGNYRGGALRLGVLSEIVEDQFHEVASLTRDPGAEAIAEDEFLPADDSPEVKATLEMFLLDGLILPAESGHLKLNRRRVAEHADALGATRTWQAQLQLPVCQRRFNRDRAMGGGVES